MNPRQHGLALFAQASHALWYKFAVQSIVPGKVGKMQMLNWDTDPVHILLSDSVRGLVGR